MDFELSSSTVCEVSPLLGHPLADWSAIRDEQDQLLIDRWQAATSRTLDLPEQQNVFYYGSIDFLVHDDGQGKRFVPIEFNGTSTESFRHMTDRAILDTLECLASVVADLTDDMPLILVPYSGSLATNAFGNSPKLVHEKILVAEAIKTALIERYGSAEIVPLILLKPGEPLQLTKPTVILGYSKDFVDYLGWQDGRPLFNDHPISASTHDMLAEYIHAKFQEPFDFNKYRPMNRFYPISSDKGNFYKLINRYLSLQSYQWVPGPIDFQHAHNVEELIDKVIEGVNQGKKLVIKPHGSGLGRGIDFFTHPESPEKIIEKIDASIHAAQQYYVIGTPFPYTICQYVEGCTIDDPSHAKFGHRYELRVNLYRTGNRIHAIPILVKISSMPHDPTSSERRMLLNNVSVSQGTGGNNSNMLALSNDETLALLGISLEQMEELCDFSTGVTHFAIQHAVEETQVFYTWSKESAIKVVMD